ncbi:MIP/aquaporin family protein [Arthrobacter sp. CJ23]|uniref:MIP/aquaporin family protein n=1 Tax=Arthrobacter sp. CJ23 TaxID=2972479 RepID=UPI00215D282B|nr:aquaporin [Arthrobacter sp. CJ23]UVJ38200.1 aquaporin [Arthrobacter sp. CJ23]
MTSPAPVSAVRGPGLVARLSAEALGTLFLVLVAIGVPMFTLPQSNPLPASLAAGFAVTAGMLAFGYISGGHFNPAITLGNLIAGRIRPLAAAAYVGAQLVGAVLGALLLFGVLRTLPGIPDSRAAFDTVAAGFGEHSTVQAPMAGVLLVEVVGAALLVAVFLGTTTGRKASPAMAPFAVGLTLAVLLQFGQSIGNTPFNPARATAHALFSSSWAVEGLWLFWVAPLVGAALAGLVYRGFADAAALVPAAAAVPIDGDDDIDEDDDETFDADAAPAAAAAAAEPAGEATAAPSAAPASPAAPAADEARDFFDGKKA